MKKNEIGLYFQKIIFELINSIALSNRRHVLFTLFLKYILLKIRIFFYTGLNMKNVLVYYIFIFQLFQLFFNVNVKYYRYANKCCSVEYFRGPDIK